MVDHRDVGFLHDAAEGAELFIEAEAGRDGAGDFVDLSGDFLSEAFIAEAEEAEGGRVVAPVTGTALDPEAGELMPLLEENLIDLLIQHAERGEVLSDITRALLPVQKVRTEAAIDEEPHPGRDERILSLRTRALVRRVALAKKLETATIIPVACIGLEHFGQNLLTGIDILDVIVVRRPVFLIVDGRRFFFI